MTVGLNMGGSSKKRVLRLVGFYFLDFYDYRLQEGCFIGSVLWGVITHGVHVLKVNRKITVSEFIPVDSVLSMNSLFRL